MTMADAPGRIGYIDAMRGFTMVLVVFFHALLFMHPDAADSSPVSSVLMSFRMPLFFFVSGFFAYRAADRWTSEVTADIMVRKIRAQILCATVFFMLYQYVWGLDPWAFVHTGYNYFWFTIGLFQMFALYVALNLVSRLTRRDITVPALVALSAAAALSGLVTFGPGVGQVLAWHKVVQYFPYFAAGILARRYRAAVAQLLDDDRFRTCVILLFVSGCFWFYHDSYSEPASLPQYLLQGLTHRMAGLFTVLIFFHSRASWFEGGGRMARALRFTGTRTLDVYMTHMFFIPHLAGLHLLGDLQLPSMSVFKLGFALSVAVAIVALCLLCGAVLRSSHFLSVWLFGVRRRRESTAQRRTSAAQGV